ncbi:MAG: prolipoprotein diacylglyceryl transferase [Bacteroidia bacterium]|nr:prolipoprotein diacylglyceryl transferase [Bacteroidia bacterium]
MTFPINIKTGSFEISSHLILELLAYSIGFRYFLFLRKRTNDTISTEHRSLIFIAAAAGAFLFSRIVGYLDSNDFFNGNYSLAALYGNKTILGGLLGGLIGVEICKKIIGVTTSSGDLMTYPLLLAMIIGRIGCFMAGLEDGTFGTASALPWAIDFGDGLRRHPTNLYEILFLLITALFLVVVEKKYTLQNGARFKLFLFGYLVFRFFIEFIKPVHRFEIGLSAIQLACVCGILYYYKLILRPASLFQNN